VNDGAPLGPALLDCDYVIAGRQELGEDVRVCESKERYRKHKELDGLAAGATVALRRIHRIQSTQKSSAAVS
jgi:hypothetical protein